MKLRILENAIRLGLDRSEVDDIAAGQALVASTHFPDGQVFGYQLAASADATEAVFDGSVIMLRIAQAALLSWAADEHQVGIRESLPTAEGKLELLIEKDFECLEPRIGEDQSNRFVNPKALP